MSETHQYALFRFHLISIHAFDGHHLGPAQRLGITEQQQGAMRMPVSPSSQVVISWRISGVVSVASPATRLWLS
jgi:hypothetical protein